jgi:hypothetical protein
MPQLDDATRALLAELREQVASPDPEVRNAAAARAHRLLRELGKAPDDIVAVASATVKPRAGPQSNPQARLRHPNSPWQMRLGRARGSRNQMPHASRWYGGRKYRCISIYIGYDDTTTACGDTIRRSWYGYAITVGSEMLFDRTDPKRFYTCGEARDGADELAGDIEKLGLRAGIEAFTARNFGRK